MRRAVASMSLATSVLLGSLVVAQKATEIFIPIGQSPGVSGVSTVIGTIVSYDEATRTLTISSEAGEQTATLTEGTSVWLDRSNARQANTTGSSADCRAGRRCEIKFVYDGETRTAEAEWVKIQVEE